MKRFALLLPLLGACTAAPPAAPPPCPSSAPAPPRTLATTEAASTAATESAPPSAVKTQTPKDAATLGFCTVAEQSDAHKELDALGTLIRALPRDASPSDVLNERVTKLHASPCYANGQLSRDFRPAEIRAARAWSIAKWWEDGGDVFLRASLTSANALHFAPSVPTLLAGELLSSSEPVRAILCPTFGPVCDPVAQGAALDVGRELERAGLLRMSHGSGDEPASEQECARAIAKEAMGDRLARFTACVDSLVPRRPALPEARYRSPKGWLVLRGRRGHYQFCDEVRAYHLDTGAAFVASRCSGLVLMGGGSVDQDATRDAGGMKTQVGTVSVDALRRLALVLWLKDRVDDKDRPYSEIALPVGIPLPDPKSLSGFGYGSSGWMSSAQTSIRFEIADGASPLVAGTFRWPGAYAAADQAADDLVRSTEATLREGCPPAALPASLAPAGPLGGVSPIDASADSLRKTAADLATAFTKLRATKVCPPSGPAATAKK